MVNDEALRLFGALHPDVDVAERSDGTWSAEGLFHPLPEHRGRKGWLHGGLAATVLDHVCARAASAALGQPVVTGRLDTRYREPVLLAEGPYRVVAAAERPGSKTVRVSGAIERRLDRQVFVEVRSLFVVLGEDPLRRSGRPRPATQPARRVR